MLWNPCFAENFKLTTIKTQPVQNSFKASTVHTYNLSSQRFRLCLPLILLHSAFDKIHEYSHAGLHNARINFNRNYHIPFLSNCSSIFFLDCIDCQMHKYKKLKQNKAAILAFLKLSFYWTIVFLGILNVQTTLLWRTNH